MNDRKKPQTAQMTFTVGFGVPVLLRLHFSPNRSQIAQLYVTSYIKSALKEGENATHPASPPTPPALPPPGAWAAHSPATPAKAQQPE